MGMMGVQVDQGTPLQHTIKNTTVDWLHIVEDKRTGVYLNEHTQTFEFRGYTDEDEGKYVIIGYCPRLSEMHSIDDWQLKCVEYMLLMSEAH